MDAVRPSFDISNFKKVCRLCLKNENGMKSLFSKNKTTAKNAALLEMILEFTTVQLQPVDGLESQICSTCMGKVQEFQTFRLKCIENEEILQTALQEDDDNDLTIEIEPDLFEITPDFEEPVSSNEDYSENFDKSYGDSSSFIGSNHDPAKIDVRNTIIYVDNQKLYQCPFCEKTFSQSGNLKAHINTHTGFKPYCCQVCMRAFAQKSNLNYHMKSAHNPNRPFKCDSCEKSFKTKEELSRHIENKHDVVTEINDDGIKLVKYPKKGRASTKKLHGCPYCGKCFGQSFNLKLHINTHTGEKPYQCQYCNKAFAQKSNLNVHINKNHSSLAKTGEAAGRREAAQVEEEAEVDGDNDGDDDIIEVA